MCNLGSVSSIDYIKIGCETAGQHISRDGSKTVVGINLGAWEQMFSTKSDILAGLTVPTDEMKVLEPPAKVAICLVRNDLPQRTLTTDLQGY